MKLRKAWVVGVAIVLLAGGAVSWLSYGNAVRADPAERDNASSLFVYANTAIGFLGAPDYSSVCVESSRYYQGEEVVWRIRVLDQNKQPMDDMQLKSVVVKLPDGEEFPAVYGGHPGGPAATDYFWSAAWQIPGDYPTGTLGYEVTATALHGYRTGTFSDFNVDPSLLTIVAPPSS